MLIDTQYLSKSKQLLTSYIDSNGEMKVKYFEWAHPFKIQTCDPSDSERDPDYKSWDGKNIKKVYGSLPDRYSTYEFLESFPKSETEDIFNFYNPKIYFIDIETEVIDGFPDPNEAPTMIQSISIVYDDKIILLGLKDLSEKERKDITNDTNAYFKGLIDFEYKLKYIKYNDEFDMLSAFFNKMLPKMPCITGWNFIDFDLKFLINRARKITKNVNGKIYHIDPRVASYTRKLNSLFGKEDCEVPAHKLVFDYMDLYKSLDTSVKVKESNSLDFVSKNILGVNKIDYKGSLTKLYEDDYKKFMYYNAVDSVLVQQIHNKMKYIDIIFAISSLARIKAVDVYSYQNGSLASLAITEGVLRNRFKELSNILIFKDYSKNVQPGNKIKGGWVKDPKVGMNKWVSCYDFASLYPTTQRQFFIAPENYVGSVDKSNPEQCISSEGNVIPIDSNVHVVCSNGVVFKKENSPTLIMLEEVYKDRKMNKKKMMEKKMEVKKLTRELEKLKSSIEDGE